MKATYNPNAKTKFSASHRKESPCYFSEIAIIDPDAPSYGVSVPYASAPITARFYGTGSRNYCCLWVNADPIHTSGSAYAGGGGYHRPSAALAQAIANAGFALSESIAGVGTSAMEEALVAIAHAVGIKRPLIHRAHP